MDEFHESKIVEFRKELNKFEELVMKSKFEYNQSNVYRMSKIYNLMKQVQDDVCIFKEDIDKPYEESYTRVEILREKELMEYIGPFLLVYIMMYVNHSSKVRQECFGLKREFNCDLI
jgi:hypothetical protein